MDPGAIETVIESVREETRRREKGILSTHGTQPCLVKRYCKFLGRTFAHGADMIMPQQAVIGMTALVFAKSRPSGSDHSLGWCFPKSTGTSTYLSI